MPLCCRLFGDAAASSLPDGVARLVGMKPRARRSGMVDAVLEERKSQEEAGVCAHEGLPSRAGARKPRRRSGSSKAREARELGRRGEDAAARYLFSRGYDILERNWTCFAGEADIIARDESALVFVEVKTRSGCEKGFPAEAVNAEKRERYEKIALAFLSEYDVADISVRFDVVSIVVIAPDRALIRHQIDAFSAA